MLGLHLSKAEGRPPNEAAFAEDLVELDGCNRPFGSKSLPNAVLTLNLGMDIEVHPVTGVQHTNLRAP